MRRFLAGLLALALIVAGVDFATASGWWLRIGNPPLIISGAPVTTGTVGTPYTSWSCSARNGNPPYTYMVNAGTLPAGLTLNSSTCLVSGTPTAAGTNTGIVIRATDLSNNHADLAAFQVVISASSTAIAKLGGGGWLVGGDVAYDGQRLARTDTYGAYLWNSGTSSWTQVVNQTAMPAAQFGYYGDPDVQVYQNGGGVQDIAACPTSSATIYMAYSGKVFSSTNHGSTWTNTNFKSPSLTTTATTASGATVLTFASVPSWVSRGMQVYDLTSPTVMPTSSYISATSGTTVTLTNQVVGAGVGNGDSIAFTVPMLVNSTYRMNGRKMAVDPNNCNHVYVGTDQNGLYETTDGGNTWAVVGGVPTAAANAGANYNIAFDSASGTTTVGGRTQTKTIYVMAYQASSGAVDVSNDGGVTWAATTGGPTTVEHMVVAGVGSSVNTSPGFVYAVDGLGSGALWKYSGTYSGGVCSCTWSSILSSGDALHSVAVDPADNTHIIAGTTGGGLYESTNTGGSFTAETSHTRVATDVPWLANANESFMSAGDYIFDPSGSNRLVFFEGIGVWTTTPPGSGSVTWTSATQGIEQLVSHKVIAPNGYPVVGVSDRGTFQLPNYSTAYPSTTQGVIYNNDLSLNITADLDYAQGNTNFMASVSAAYLFPENTSGFSTDGGATWQPFNSYFQNIDGATKVANNGSGLVRLTLPNTTGLANWTAGSSARNTIIRIQPSTVSGDGTPGSALRRSFYISNLTSTTMDLVGSTFSSALQAGNYNVYADTNPLSDNDGNAVITNIVNNAGASKVTVSALKGTNINNTEVCITGITTGTTEANGCWVVSASAGDISANSFTLTGSTFTNIYTSGGTANMTLPLMAAVAVSDANNIMVVSANYDYPQCTTDGGKTWTQIRVPSGIAANGNTGWVQAYYLNGHVLAADRTTTGVFYAYNSIKGTYKITNCGTSPGLNSVTVANSGFNDTLLPVPGFSDLLFSFGGISSGGINHPGGGALKWGQWVSGSTTMWKDVPGTQEPWCVGLGAIAGGSDYPTIYYVGWYLVNSQYQYGMWKSTSNRASWTATPITATFSKVTDYPNGTMDNVATCNGDMTASNKWYTGFNGSGFAYGQ